MAINSADSLRFFSNDQPRQMIETKYGDGTAQLFQMSGMPMVTGATAFGGYTPSAFVPHANGWTATGATFSLPLGTVTFPVAISANSAFQVSYTYATFSDFEIDMVTGLYPGDSYSQRLALIDNLMADSYKRARWAAGRGAYFDDSTTMQNLMLLRSAIRGEATTEQGPLGDIISWDDQQANY